jgi:hypothetical protein
LLEWESAGLGGLATCNPTNQRKGVQEESIVLEIERSVGSPRPTCCRGSTTLNSPSGVSADSARTSLVTAEPWGGGTGLGCCWCGGGLHVWVGPWERGRRGLGAKGFAPAPAEGDSPPPRKQGRAPHAPPRRASTLPPPTPRRQAPGHRNPTRPSPQPLNPPNPKHPPTRVYVEYTQTHTPHATPSPLHNPTDPPHPNVYRASPRCCPAQPLNPSPPPPRFGVSRFRV